MSKEEDRQPQANGDEGGRFNSVDGDGVVIEMCGQINKAGGS
jgi:hypothetical protein